MVIKVFQISVLLFLCGFASGRSFDTTLIFNSDSYFGGYIAHVPQVGVTMTLQEMMTASCPGYYTLSLYPDTSDMVYGNALIRRTVPCGGIGPQDSAFWEANHDTVEYQVQSLSGVWFFKITDSIRKDTDSTFILKFAFRKEDGSYVSLLGKDTAQWNYVYDMGDMILTKILKIYGDTVIAANHYRYVYDVCEPELRYCQDTRLVGFMREDTISGRAWVLPIDGADERLFYDLSLLAGDTFFFIGKYGDRDSRIVDSAMQLDGRKIIRFKYDNNSEDAFREGLPPDGEFIQVLFQDFYTDMGELLCAFKDGERIYHNTTLGSDSCIVIGGGAVESSKQISQEPRISALPNPFNPSVVIDFSQLQGPVAVCIYDITGKSVAIFNGITEQRFAWNAAGMPSGVYVGRVTTGGRTAEVRLFLAK